jgi:hypothetical protein
VCQWDLVVGGLRGGCVACCRLDWARQSFGGGDDSWEVQDGRGRLIRVVDVWRRVSIP